MEAVVLSNSETSVNLYETTLRNIPGDSHLQDKEISNGMIVESFTQTGHDKENGTVRAHTQTVPENRRRQNHGPQGFATHGLRITD
jgi:hypothetical protein